MRKSICFGTIFLLLTWPIWSEENFNIRGYYKNFSILFMPPSYKLNDTTLANPDMGAVNNRLRLKVDLDLSPKCSFQLDYDFSPRIQDASLFKEDAFIAEFKPLEYRLDDFRARLYPRAEETAASFGLFHNLDRFSLTIKSQFSDIFIGRQAIAWGSARVINPTDIIAPFAFNELDKEERRGVDAVRMRVPLGMMDELDVGFVAGRKFDSEKNAFFLRGKIYKLRTDMSCLLIAFRKHLLIGLDLARSIGGAGFWLETAYVIPDYFRGANDKSDQNYFRASIGLDYNLNSKTYGFLEYHFNSSGKSRPINYTRFLESSAFKDGSVYLMSRNYLNLGTTYQLSSLSPLTGLLIFNLNDMSLMTSSFLEYNIAENIYLAAGAYIGIGKKPEVNIDPQALHPLFFRSEFGSYPDMLFTSFRVYF